MADQQERVQGVMDEWQEMRTWVQEIVNNVTARLILFSGLNLQENAGQVNAAEPGPVVHQLQSFCRALSSAIVGTIIVAMINYINFARALKVVIHELVPINYLVLAGPIIALCVLYQIVKLVLKIIAGIRALLRG